MTSIQNLYSINLKHKIAAYRNKTYGHIDVFRLAFILLSFNTLIAIINSWIGLDYPYNTFLVWPSERFGDLLRGVDGFGIVNVWPGFESDFIYYEHLLPFPATCYFMAANLISLIGNKYVFLLLLYSIILFLIALVSIRKKNSLSVIFFVVFSYPMIFAMDRGNIASLVFLLLLIALTTKRIVISTLCIALATSIKLTPVVFIILLFLDRPVSVKWIITVVFFFLVWFFIINLIVIQYNGHFLWPSVFDPFVLFSTPLQSYSIRHVNTLQGLGFGSSLYMPLVYLARRFNIPETFNSYQIVLLVSIIIGFCLVLKNDLVNKFHWLLEKKNMLFVSCISFVLLTPVTADYYLLILFIPLLAFPKTVFSIGYCLIFALALGSKNIFFLAPATYLGNIDISLQVFINPILLLLLLLGEFNLIKFINRDDSKSTATDSVIMQFLITVRDQLSTFINRYKKSLILFLGITIAVAALMFRVQLSAMEMHNTTAGLPIDFNSEIYLELNPGLEEYWRSVDIVHKDKMALWNHAEQHYIGFGSNDGWEYRSLLQKILYNKYVPINLIAWPFFLAPIIILLLLFLQTLISIEQAYRLINFLHLHKIKVIIAMAIIIFAFAAISGAPRVLRIIHNKEVGLPLDFDPEMYLKMNPQLEQYWESIGVNHQSRQALLEHAELHYRDFGAKDGWHYK